MRRIILLMAVAAFMAVMVLANAAPAFAACPLADTGPVTANDQAQGCFGTAQGIANDKSNRHADRGLMTAYFNNTTP